MNITRNIDKYGTIGIFITALVSPCCFPLFAFGASALGLGTFELFGSWTMWVFQILVLISLGGLYLSYRRHRCLYPLMVAFPSGLLIFYAFNGSMVEYFAGFVYVGMIGLFIASIWNYRRNKLHSSCSSCSTYNGKPVELSSTLTCPNCGFQKTETMPTDACVHFYSCEKCKTLLKPLSGDCCVYCSYGSVKCPPIQAGESCC